MLLSLCWRRLSSTWLEALQNVSSAQTSHQVKKGHFKLKLFPNKRRNRTWPGRTLLICSTWFADETQPVNLDSLLSGKQAFEYVTFIL